MRISVSTLTLAAVIGVAPGLGAQQKKTEPKKEPSKSERCIKNGDTTECRYFSTTSWDSVMAKRAVLGVQLSPTGTKRDTLGVFVSRVTPNGPAEKAGVVEGDRIVSINGIDLRVNAADAEDDYASGLPQRRLTREVEKLAPGNAVNLRVYSGGRIRDVNVTLGKASEFREIGGAFGSLMPGMGNVWVRPNFDGMRMQLNAMPKIRMEQMMAPRMRFEQLAPKIRMEMMPRLNEMRDRMRIERLAPGRYRLIGPDGERVWDGATSWSIGPDGVIIMGRNTDREKIVKEKAEKERAEKKKK